MTNALQAYRGQIFYFKDDAQLSQIKKHKVFDAHQADYVFYPDGLLVVENGRVKQAGAYAALKKQLPDEIHITDYSGRLITPGFIDTHLHACQSLAVAAYGEKLLAWLENYIFPTEALFENEEHAEAEIEHLLDLLLRNGTTTACIYAPAQYEAADLLFEKLRQMNMRAIAGNVLMDRNVADALITTAEQAYEDSEKLIERWHQQGRLHYAVTPRFAIACSEAMLEVCRELRQKHPNLYAQTHLNETRDEIAFTRQLFSRHASYLEIYQHYGLVHDQAIFGHCIHNEARELELLRESQAIIAWCPVSNHFLGSGKFNFGAMLPYSENITLASDYAAGNSVSMFRVLDDAYKVALLQDYKLSTLQRWFMATLGAAKALKLDDKIGNFSAGKEADFIVINPAAHPDIAHRLQTVRDIYELLFVLMTLGDDRIIEAVYLQGKRYAK